MDSTTAMSYHTGLDGFIWFIGIVESRATDPLHVNRCKVRALGFHELDKRILPTDDLPWALPLLPLTASRTTIDIHEGDWVIGFFLDAQTAQQPIIFGKIPAYPGEEVGSKI